MDPVKMDPVMNVMNVTNNHVSIKDLTTVENRKELFISAHYTTFPILANAFSGLNLFALWTYRITLSAIFFTAMRTRF
jgi:nitrate reductase NapE component